MNEKVWVRPLTMVQQFEANEYVAACGDSGVVYNFECNAGNKRKKYDVVTDSGVNLTKDSWGGLNYYHPCSSTHEAESNDEFILGWMYNSGGDDSRIRWSEKTRVIIWTDGGTDVHCTTNLDMDSWETAKS